jgi:flagellar biosynthesis GTPase FlhF
MATRKQVANMGFSLRTNKGDWEDLKALLGMFSREGRTEVLCCQGVKIMVSEQGFKELRKVNYGVNTFEIEIKTKKIVNGCLQPVSGFVHRIVQVQGRRDKRFKTFALMIFGPGYLLLVGLKDNKVVSVREAVTIFKNLKKEGINFVGDTKGHDSWARNRIEEIFAETMAVTEMIRNESVDQKKVRFTQHTQVADAWPEYQFEWQKQQQQALQQQAYQLAQQKQSQQQQQALQQRAYMEDLQRQRAYYAHLHAQAVAQEQAYAALLKAQQQPVEATMVEKAGQVVDQVQGFFGNIAEEVKGFFTSSKPVMAPQL